MKRTLKVRVGSPAAALGRFEATWKRAARGEKVAAEHVLTFANLQLLPTDGCQLKAPVTTRDPRSAILS